MLCALCAVQSFYKTINIVREPRIAGAAQKNQPRRSAADNLSTMHFWLNINLY